MSFMKIFQDAINNVADDDDTSIELENRIRTLAESYLK